MYSLDGKIEELAPSIVSSATCTLYMMSQQFFFDSGLEEVLMCIDAVPESSYTRPYNDIVRGQI